MFNISTIKPFKQKFKFAAFLSLPLQIRKNWRKHCCRTLRLLPDKYIISSIVSRISYNHVLEKSLNWGNRCGQLFNLLRVSKKPVSIYRLTYKKGKLMQKPMTIGVWPLLLDRQTKCRTLDLKLRRSFVRSVCDSRRLFSYLTTNDMCLADN